MNGVFLVEPLLVFAVKRLNAHRADDAVGLALLLAHVGVDDFLLNLAPVFAQGGAAGAEVGEEFRAVVVELLGLDVGDAVVDEAFRDALLLVLAEFLHNEDTVNKALDDVVLEFLELLVEFLLAAGFTLNLLDERGDFPADIVHGDDLVLGDRGDAVGEAQVQSVRGAHRGGLAEGSSTGAGGE